MMAYAMIIDDEVVEYPFDPGRVRVMFPHMSFPEYLTDEALASVGVVTVGLIDPPATTSEEAAAEGKPELIGGQWRQSWTVSDRTSSELAIVKAAMLAQIDQLAERARLRFITAGEGQAMTYIAKNAEALAWFTDTAALTPFLAAEARALGITIAALAADVRQQALAWQLVGAAIEAVRRGLKVAVGGAATFAALEAISIEQGWPA